MSRPKIRVIPGPNPPPVRVRARIVKRIKASDLGTGAERMVYPDDPCLFRFETGPATELTEHAYIMDATLKARLAADEAATFAFVDHLQGSGGPISGWSVDTMGSHIPDGERQLLQILGGGQAEDGAEAYELIEDLLRARFRAWSAR
jgi:hypothetical protein